MLGNAVEDDDGVERESALRVPDDDEAASSRDMPKSQRTTRPSAPTRKLRGAMSRCTMRCACRCATAAHASRASRNHCAGDGHGDTAMECCCWPKCKCGSWCCAAATIASCSEPRRMNGVTSKSSPTASVTAEAASPPRVRQCSSPLLLASLQPKLTLMPSSGSTLACAGKRAARRTSWRI